LFACASCLQLAVAGGRAYDFIQGHCATAPLHIYASMQQPSRLAGWLETTRVARHDAQAGGAGSWPRACRRAEELWLWLRRLAPCGAPHAPCTMHHAPCMHACCPLKTEEHLAASALPDDGGCINQSAIRNQPKKAPQSIRDLPACLLRDFWGRKWLCLTAARLQPFLDQSKPKPKNSE
jgi:hypothetical protein